MNVSGIHASKSFVDFILLDLFYGKRSNNNDWQNGSNVVDEELKYAQSRLVN